MSGRPAGAAPLHIRAAAPDDVAAIFAFVRELAEYERAADQVTGTPAMLREALFGARPSAEALVAAREPEIVGFALFHGTFSTWECRPGLWLEDLYVPERHRRGGVGLRLLSALAAIAVDRGCARLEWTALDWNAPALAFYAGLDAVRLEEWTTHRLDGDSLRALAARPGWASTGPAGATTPWGQDVEEPRTGRGSSVAGL